MNPALLALSSASTLVHLSPVDLVIIVFYFALVLAIGLYLKEQANTGEDFFMAGREMTAWVALFAVLMFRPNGLFGGGIHARSAKSIALTPQVKAALQQWRERIDAWHEQTKGAAHACA